jgi:hypothetical protein
MVHFLPKTPKVVLIGQFNILTRGLITNSSSFLSSDIRLFLEFNYTFNPILALILYFVYQNYYFIDRSYVRD